MIRPPVNQPRTCAVSGRVSCQVPNGDWPIIGIQLGALPRLVLIVPLTVVAAPPTAAGLPDSKNCSELTLTSKVCPAAIAKYSTTCWISMLFRLAGKSVAATSNWTRIGVGVWSGLFRSYHWSGRSFTKLYGRSWLTWPCSDWMTWARYPGSDMAV